METPFGKYLNSPLFTFYVGPDKMAFHVHSQAVARMSRSLDFLMNGPMSEATAREVDWSEVDVDTFIRLCEFAYHEDYTCPQANIRFGWPPVHNASSFDCWNPLGSDFQHAIATTSPEHSVTIGKTTLVRIDNTRGKIQWYNNPKPPENGILWKHPLQRTLERASSTQKYEAKDTNYRTPTNTSAKEDFTPVFVEQARLYVLADMYGIEPLCDLVISKLHTTLSEYTLYPGSVNEIVEFVRFVYANTMPGAGSHMTPLRKLVAQYVSSILGLIAPYPEFEDLLREGGDFPPDVFLLMWKGVEKYYGPPVLLEHQRLEEPWD